MSTLNTATQVINTLVEATKLPKAYVENGASLWVLSIKDMIARAKKQGSGSTLITKGGYITTRQTKETISSLPFFQSMEVTTFGCKVKEDKVSAAYSSLIWKQDGHEYPYNTKLQFSVKLCQEICLAALGKAGLGMLFTHQLEDHPNSTPLELLKGVTSPAMWWNKLQKVLLCSDLQIQLLVVVDASKIQNKVVSKVYGSTDQYAFDFDVTEHIVGFQVVSANNPQYIWGLGLPKDVVQVVTASEEETVTFYKSVEEIPLTTKNAESQLRKFFISFLNDNEEYHADQEAGRAKFLETGIKSAKLKTWLTLDGNLDKANNWLARVKFTPKSATKSVDLETKTIAKETRQAAKAAGAIIPPVEEKKEEPKPALASTFASDEDDEWGISSDE